MDGARTRGQPAAIRAVRAMLRSGVPHAILLAGPAGVGKTTLALDLAAALLCGAPDLGDRPCRTCRTCRTLEGGNHPDLHRLGPGGPGAQISIGGPERPRGVRDLIGELVLMPVEGGARVAIIEEAHRLTEDAQSALLKTLEEPPNGVVMVLCVEEEERLLPTVRSRCARVRLGPVGVREIEALLGEHGLADPPLAARLARIAGGRPGVAMAYARAPESEVIRADVARRILDLLGAPPAARLGAVRELLARAGDLSRTLEAVDVPVAGRASRSRAGKGMAARSVARPASGPSTPTSSGAPGNRPSAAADGRAEDLTSLGGSVASDEPEAVVVARPAAPERRRAAATLIGIWQDLARDLALVAIGERRRVRDPGLLEEIESAAEMLADSSGHAASGFLARLARAADLLEGHVAPELILDTLVLAWPTPMPPARADFDLRGTGGVARSA